MTTEIFRFPSVIFKRSTQFVTVLLCVFLLKLLYSTATPEDLRWILAPTTILVEFLTGTSFTFEPHAGYLSADRGFLIAGSCAGVNFLIAAFLMLSLRRTFAAKMSWRYLPAALFVSYIATLAANTVRISTALHFQKDPIAISSLSPTELHRLEGIVIYFGFLLLLFVLSDKWGDSGNKTAASRKSFSWLVFPLLIYYVTTLGLPLANAAYEGGFAVEGFWDHSLFVLLAPLAVIFPFVGLRTIRGIANERPITKYSTMTTSESPQL